MPVAGIFPRWRAIAVIAFIALSATSVAAQPIPLCTTAPRVSCVVDGDTFWWEGVRIRIENIDAPETHGSKCAAELQLGTAARDRLASLLGSGDWHLARNPSEPRDTDRFGRLLRRVVDEQRGDLGAVLVNEGLAATWTGRRATWCDDE